MTGSVFVLKQVTLWLLAYRNQTQTHTHLSPLLSPYDVNSDFIHGTSAELLTHTTPTTPSITPSQLPHWKEPLLLNKVLYVLNVYEHHFYLLVILLVWSKWNVLYFQKSGFSPTPVTKQYPSWTWPWFNPFEILPIKMRSVCRVWITGFGTANIHSTNSLPPKISFEPSYICFLRYTATTE